MSVAIHSSVNSPASSIQAAVYPVTPAVHAPVDPVAFSVQTAINAIAPVVEATIDAIPSPVHAPFDPIAFSIQATVDSIAPAIEAMIDAITPAVQAPVDPIAFCLQPVSQSFSTLLARLIRFSIVLPFDPVTAPIETLIDAIPFVVQATFYPIPPAVQAIVDALAPAIQAVVDPVALAIQAIIHAITTPIKAIIDPIAPAIQAVVDPVALIEAGIPLFTRLGGGFFGPSAAGVSGCTYQRNCESEQHHFFHDFRLLAREFGNDASVMGNAPAAKRLTRMSEFVRMILQRRSFGCMAAVGLTNTLRTYKRRKELKKTEGCAMFTADEILDMAIRIEKNGEQIYRNAIDKAANPTIASLLGWMADEEKQHAEFFRKMKKTIQASGDNAVANAFGHEILDKLLQNQSFSLVDIDFSKIEQIKDLIGVFIEFEEDSVLFYQMLESFLQDDDAREELRRVIDEENRHIKKLKDFLVSKPETITHGQPG